MVRIHPRLPAPGTALFPLLAAALLTSPLHARLVINECDADQAGTDTAEFVELYDGGAGNTALDGYVLVFYNGSVDLSCAAYDLDGSSTDASGFFGIGNTANEDKNTRS